MSFWSTTKKAGIITGITGGATLLLGFAGAYGVYKIGAKVFSANDNWTNAGAAGLLYKNNYAAHGANNVARDWFPTGDASFEYAIETIASKRAGTKGQGAFNANALAQIASAGRGR